MVQTIPLMVLINMSALICFDQKCDDKYDVFITSNKQMNTYMQHIHNHLIHLIINVINMSKLSRLPSGMPGNVLQFAHGPAQQRALQKTPPSWKRQKGVDFLILFAQLSLQSHLKNIWYMSYGAFSSSPPIQDNNSWNQQHPATIVSDIFHPTHCQGRWSGRV